ncbi:MAG: ADP-ribosylglycohydrolase family protein [Clostridiales bacterium]|jgi:ADP-ribosylglycohydrolase|nr:ADP-ribosylglycohydrolase family protein [Clostridiales bacterium]
MNGSILGDIAGSRFEFSRPQNFNFRKVALFADDCFYTDDTVMTIATKYAIYNQMPYSAAYASFGRKYPFAGYGTMFKKWFENHNSKAYNSYGNGAAMRAGFIGEHFSTLDQVQSEAEKSAMCTHNHPEGVKGAVATASCVFLCRQGFSKKEIKKYVEKKFGYNLHRSLKTRRPFAKFDITCQGTVPLAILCFLESNDWEDCIRNVFSIRCDTDTVGCIAGGIAEAYYGETGFDEKLLLKKYLIKTNNFGNRDTYLYEWAIR